MYVCITELLCYIPETSTVLLLLLLSHQLCPSLGDPWTALHQASLSFTISLSSLKLRSTELMMPSNHLILCHPLLLHNTVHQLYTNKTFLN